VRMSLRLAFLALALAGRLPWLAFFSLRCGLAMTPIAPVRSRLVVWNRRGYHESGRVRRYLRDRQPCGRHDLMNRSPHPPIMAMTQPATETRIAAIRVELEKPVVGV